MNNGPPGDSQFDPGDATITTVLRIEHRLLRVMMEAMAEWLAGAPATASAEMKTRFHLLFLALEAHAQREEQHLFVHLRPLSARARHLVDMMVLVHDEVRDLFEEIKTLENPKDHLWTMLDLTQTHFVREEQDVFPLAEELLSRDFLENLAKQG